MGNKMWLAGAVAATCAACAPTVWVRSGASQQDFVTDRYVCERDARQSGYFGGGIVGALNMQDFWRECMLAHGWRPQAAPSTAAASPAPTPDPPPSAFGAAVDTHGGAGLIVTEVMHGGVAERAGLQKDDVIMDFAGDKATSPEGLQATIDRTRATHSPAPLDIVRNGKSLQLMVTY
jgi:hypothetical protein